MTTPAIRTITFDATTMRVELLDGRTFDQPIERFPRLLHATPEQRRNYRIGFGGTGIHWDELDEDLSVAGLLEEQGR
jgi:hypothetical protein